MLRLGLLAVGLLLIGIGLVLYLMPAFHSGSTLLIWGLVITIAVLCERWRYEHTGKSKNERWQQTDECFEDPETGQIIDVLYDPIAGERKYEPRGSDSK